MPPISAAQGSVAQRSLSLLLTAIHGAKSVSVELNIASFGSPDLSRPQFDAYPTVASLTPSALERGAVEAADGDELRDRPAPQPGRLSSWLAEGHDRGDRVCVWNSQQH